MTRTPVRADDRGSLPMVMLVITVGLAMSAVLAPLVVRQIVSTRSADDRNTALNAAQAGLDVMMARVRAASEAGADSSRNGLLEELPPCRLSGDAGVDGVGESMAYTVTIVYRDQDGLPLVCPLEKVPTSATVTVTGTGHQITRELSATYLFTTSNTNIPGGQIKIDRSTLGDQCIDAGPSKTPAAGTQVTMQTCNGSSRQQFGYTADLYLKLIYSESSGAPYGMCLDASATHANNKVIAFEVCPATKTPRFQWSLDGESLFHSTSSSGGIEGFCLNVQSPGQASPASKVILNSCTVDDTRTRWRSGAGVGAGMAGDKTNQLVNYAQFSRCLDVTNQNTGWDYMIAWFCKQSPNGVVDWNQQWVHPVPTGGAKSKTGNIIVPRNGTQYCLRSPLNTGPSVYTTVVACTAANKDDTALQWTVFHDTGDYGTSYRIKDDSGYCLTPTDLAANPKDVHTDGTSKVKVAVCSSSELQKWNAPANIGKPSPLTDLTEK
jgi:hypothetical protein